MRKPPAGITIHLSQIPTSRTSIMAKLLELDHYPLYFYGLPGRGKTIMAATVFCQWPRQFTTLGSVDWDAEPVFALASVVCGQFASARFHYENRRILSAKYRMTSLLVLDDICDRSADDNQRASLSDIMDLRRGKPTILTGNFPPDQLSKDKLLDDRVVDRIQQGRQVEFTGPSLRSSGLPVVRMV